MRERTEPVGILSVHGGEDVNNRVYLARARAAHTHRTDVVTEAQENTP